MKGRKRKADRSPDTDTNINSRKVSKRQGAFSCSICSSTFRNGDDLHKHFKLSRCALASFTKLNDNKGRSVRSNAHEETAAGLVKYVCSYCRMVFPDCSHLEIHISKGCAGVSKHADSSVSASNDSEVVNQSSKLECGLCRMKFGSLKELISHIKLKHNVDEDHENEDDMLQDKVDYVCAKCNHEFKCSKALRNHMQSCYAENDTAFTHGRRRMFTNESNTHPQLPVTENVNEPEYQCGQCGGMFKSSKVLVEHIAAVHSVTHPGGQSSPVNKSVTEDVTVPTSLLLRYMSGIQCDGCYNVSKLNVNDKCTFCNHLISIKLNQVICICMHIPFTSLESLSSHLLGCKYLQEISNRKYLVLKYSNKDHKRRLCVNDQVTCPDIVRDYLSESSKMQKESKESGTLNKLEEKNKNEGHGMVGKSAMYSSAHLEGGREVVEIDNTPSFTEQRSIIIEDYDSEFSDTDSSGFEEIFIDQPSAANTGTQSNREHKEENYIFKDTDMIGTISENVTELKVEIDKALAEYDIFPCKVVLERISESKIESYLCKRKHMSSPEESKRSRFKRAQTNKLDKKANEQRVKEVEESCTNSQETVSSKRAVARKRSNVRKCRFVDTYSEGKGKLAQSKLTDSSKREKSIERKNKSVKNSGVRINKVKNVEKRIEKGSESKDGYVSKEHSSSKVEVLEEEVKEKEELTCEICTSVFLSTAALEQHSETHLAAQVFKCSECDQTFSSKDSLRKHADSHALEEEFVCGICRLNFSVQEDLENHMIKHFSSPIGYQQVPKSSVVINADSSSNAQTLDTKKSNKGQHNLPKLLAYRPKINF